MKRFLIIFPIFFFILMAAAATAATIKLQVDPLGQEYDAIRIYMANAPREFAWSDPPAYVGTDTTVLISGLVPGQTYKFVAVLTRGEKESPGSNIVQEKMPVVVIELKSPKLEAVDIRAE